MPLRFALILPFLLIAGLPPSSSAQTASAAIQATVRPGNCPARARCDDNPGRGPKAKNQTGGPTAGAVPAGTSLLALDIDAPAGVQPLRIIIRPPDVLRADEMGLVVSWTASAAVQEMGSEGLRRYGVLRPAQPLRTVHGGVITVVVEY